MPTRWYMRSTTATTSPSAGDKSARTIATQTPSAPTANLALDMNAGAAETSQVIASQAVTSNQNLWMGRWSWTMPHAVNVTAQTWTYAVAMDESNTAANHFPSLSLYVWNTVGGSVRGFIYDTDSALGTEVAATGQVITFSGAAVSGVVAGDLLVLEAWTDATQSMTTSYNVTIYYNGATPVTAGGGLGDSGSYIQTPQEGFLKSLLWPVETPQRILARR